MSEMSVSGIVMHNSQKISDLRKYSYLEMKTQTAYT